MAGNHQQTELLKDDDILLIEEDVLMIEEDLVIEEDEEALVIEEDEDLLLVEEDDPLPIQEDVRCFAGTEPQVRPNPVQRSNRDTPWSVLIVDDEPAVHQATKLALSNFRFRDRPLVLLHAYSSAEAKAFLKERSDISFVLLDVVMETNDAGLKVVQYIREVLRNRRIQIILRTGQPGEAPETSIIQDYEINDYKLKTELTRQRLITAVTAALRGYCNVVAAEEKTIELEQTLNRLQQTQIQLVHSEKMSALGNLVASVAHEINNPVSAIMGNVGILEGYTNTLLESITILAEQGSEPDSDIQQQLNEVALDYVRDDLPEVLRAIKDSSDRIISLSTSLRTFSRADADIKEPFDLHDGIESTLLILRHRLKVNGHRPSIEVITEYGNLPAVHCFPGQMNQVFMNILANAIDALDEASQSRSFEDMEANPQYIRIRTAVEKQWVKLCIGDNGPGISASIRNKIFDHLFTTKSVGKGTGLGLAIAHQIVVDIHGGILAVRSDLSKGTEFVICLPVDGEASALASPTIVESLSLID